MVQPSISSIKYFIKEKMLYLFSRSKYLGKFFYCFLSREMDAEFHAVINGRYQYHKSLRKVGSNSALLRRNIHRVEKGLIMKPRKAVFAESYILETVDAFGRQVAREQGSSPLELRWARDVLDNYFAIVAPTPKVSKAHELYIALCNTYHELLSIPVQPLLQVDKLRPYPRSLAPKLSTSYEDFETLCLRRRSVRWYLNRSIPASLVRQAANVASFAPSACNRQPYKFVFTNDKDKVQRIAACVSGTKGFVDNIPAIITVVGDLSAYPFERDRHLIYVDSSLASMQFMLALECLGLSSCPINWPDVSLNDYKIKKILSLEEYERVIMLIAVGYADHDGQIPYSQKKQDKFLFNEV